MAIKLEIDYDLKIANFIMDGEIQLIGKTKRKFWNVKRELVDTSNNQIASYVIKQKPLVPYCDLHINSGIVNGLLVLHYKRYRPHVKFEVEHNQYLIVFHTGSKVSFFKNDKQFALLEKLEVRKWKKRIYKLVANENLPIGFLIMISFGLLVLVENVLEINYGVVFNLGSELFEIDTSWRPS